MQEYTLAALAEMLARGDTSCEKLTQTALARIEKYDGFLHSIGELLPNALREARQLDDERAQHGPRSPLHGIPIVLKDNINTPAPLHTCAGSAVLGSMVAPYEATVAAKLRQAGMLVLGKANLSEFAYFMSTKAPSGFSSQFGQVFSPYSKDVDPLGSSTGSAVAVAANLVPAAIGTETNGSLTAPAQANSLCTLKPTLGLVSRYGILPLSAAQDSAGPLTRTVEDAAMLMDVLWGKDAHDAATLENPGSSYAFAAACHAPVIGKRIGVLRFADDVPNAEDEEILQAAKAILQSSGAVCIEVSLPVRDIPNYDALLFEFKHDLNAYLQTMGSAAPLHSLREIIAANRENPAQNMLYGQDILELAEATRGDLSEPEYQKAKEAQLLQAAALETLLAEMHLDAVVCVGQITHGAIYGNPTLAVPAKPLTDTQPKSVTFATKKWGDEVLFSLAHVYEQATHFRTQPNLDARSKDFT